MEETGAVKRLFLSLIDSQKISKWSLKPCSSKEMAEIYACLGDNLPQEYVDFLLLAGRRAGSLMDGTDIYYPVMLRLKDSAYELLEENNLPRSLLPQDAVVFSMHQGYEFDFFLPGEVNPPVYQFVETQGLTRPWDRFSDFLAEQVEVHLKVSKRLD